MGLAWEGEAMGEWSMAAVLITFAGVAVLVRKRWRAHDHREIVCPRAQTVVRILEGVCQVPHSPRVVGFAPLCRRDCLRRSAGTTRTALLVAAVLVASALLPAYGQAPKRGGILNAMQGEDLPSGFSIHETATILGLWPVMPCYSNLVLFDPFKPRETPETILPELAEKWSWQDGYRNLVFFLRRGVRWHDGAPFTAADVKFTFDVVREAREAPAKLRINPRKEWYLNVETIETPDPYTVIFRLKRPQPSLLTMLASGYSPVLPAHIPLSTMRTRCVGTGPFRLRQYMPGQLIELERNPDYFIKDRPYLDGIRYPIVTERGTRMAALEAGRLDLSFPTEMTKVMAEQVKKTAPGIVITMTPNSGSDNVVINHRRPPFDNVYVRRAITMAPALVVLAVGIDPSRALARPGRLTKVRLLFVDRHKLPAAERGRTGTGLPCSVPESGRIVS